jgi:hypothetical protein
MVKESPARATVRRPWLSGRRAATAAAALLAALLSAAIGAELTLRANTAHLLGNPSASHGLYRSLDARHYGLTPRWRGVHHVSGRDVAVCSDADGLRAETTGRRLGAALPGERRLLLLGDSFVFGYGVEYAETFGARLEELLEQRTGTPWTVCNAGVPGHGPRDFAAAWAAHAHLSPDLVIATTFAGNDFEDDLRGETTVVAGYLLSGKVAELARDSWRVRLALRSRLAQWIEQRLPRLVPSLALDLRPEAEQRSPADRAGFPPPPQRFAGLFADRTGEDPLVGDILERTLAAYGEVEGAAGGTPVLHLLLPSWWQVQEERYAQELARLGLDPRQHRRGAMLGHLAAALTARGAEFVDLRPLFEQPPGDDDQWLTGDYHLSPTGHADLAAALVEPVLRRLGR